jgi:signal peptidase II
VSAPPAPTGTWRSGRPAGPLSPLGLAITLIVVIVDQGAKLWASGGLASGQSVPVLPFLTLYRVENTGIAFSFLSGGGGPLALATLAITAGVIAFWLRSDDGGWVAAAGFAAILGGALGNLIDRLRLGHVVDFLLLHFGDRALFVFNPADAALTVGPILLVAVYLVPSKH